MEISLANGRNEKVAALELQKTRFMTFGPYFG